MTNQYNSWLVFITLLICILVNQYLYAQASTCIFKEPLITIDFGNSKAKDEINLSLLKNYKKVKAVCPDDGYYTFAAYTYNCFGDNWHTLLSDHTPDDKNGRMMIVNASEEPGSFFVLNIAGLKPGVTYLFSTWIANICKSAQGCNPTPPSITISILSGGKLLNSFNTRAILPAYAPQWKKYATIFTIPQYANTITLQMEDITRGGCGNDFAMDDITLQECILPQPVIEIKTETIPKTIVTEKQVQKSTPVPETKKSNPSLMVPSIKEVPPINKIPSNEKPITIATETKEINKIITLPKPISSRANPVIKQIKTAASELVIELYDNGEIDGDTVSIYHNNQLLLSNAALSDKPLVFKIKVDILQPHHELIMVANNLGSIPPNTSLMIITAKNKRYEIFISSSEQKNAKIVIDLKD